MDPRHISVTPGNDSGSGGRGRGSSSGSGRRSRGSDGSGDGSVDTSRTRRSRLLAQSTGTRLMPEFNAAAGDGDGRVLGSSSSSSSGGLDPGLEESTLAYNRRRVQHEASQKPNLQRLLFHSSPVRQPTQDDEVIVMDGVLVDYTSASGPRHFSSSNDLGFAPTGSSGSGASGRYGLNRQFSDGKGDPRVVRSIKRYEMEPQIGPPAQGPGLYMQRPPTPPPTPRGFPLFPPPRPPPGAGAPRGGGATIVPTAMIPGHPGGFYPFPPSLPGVGPPRGGVATVPNAMIPGHPGGFPLFPPPSLPGARPPPPGATAVPVRTPGPPYFAPPSRTTPTAALAGPPPGFNPKRRLIRRAEAITARESERPTPPPSLPGARPPPPGATAVPVRTPGPPYFAPPPRTTPTAALAGPPPGFNPKRRLIRRAETIAARESELPTPPPSPPPPPTPVAQHKRTEFSWPPKTAADTLPVREPASSAPKQQPETEAPPAPSSAPSPREAFAWPLTEEENLLITDLLYGPSNRSRLPVFRSICPD